MINRDSNKPLYQQLKEKLQHQISLLEPHSRIPSEPSLAEEYGVSRGTVKKAIDELVLEGRLYRIPKSGTYVQLPIIQRHFKKLPSYSEEFRERGLTPGAWVLELAVEVPSEKVRTKLGLSPGKTCWRVKRVRTANGEPVLISTSYLPTSIVPELKKEEVEHSLYETLESKYQKRPQWAHESYTACKADKATASLLGIEPGMALLSSERVSYLRDGRIVEYAVTLIRGDRYEVHIDINPPSME